MIQVDRKGCSSLSDGTEIFDLIPSADTVTRSVGLSRLSPGVFKSDEPPGVFGAPKDAKAPEPRPNADEAFVEGEDTPAESGERALKGLDRPPWELSGPKRFDVREMLAPLSLLSVPVIDRDNLEELDRRVHRFAFSIGGRK
jgi:hypothetical protein